MNNFVMISLNQNYINNYQNQKNMKNKKVNNLKKKIIH